MLLSKQNIWCLSLLMLMPSCYLNGRLKTLPSSSLQIVLPLKFRLHTSSFSLKTYRAEKLIFKGTKCSLEKRRGVGHAIMKVLLSTGTQPVRFTRCSWRATNNKIYVLRVKQKTDKKIISAFPSIFSRKFTNENFGSFFLTGK